MRLKSIKLAGFKSFVDPTTVPFPHNLSAIVGPNGCGKSNVIDAVRWVMGESSAKQLRGQSLTDVIFNGTTDRQPVGQASIELLFDNSDGKLVGEYAGYSEISVRRRLTRDGVSSFFLNGTRCRRKDISDLFLGTGLGPRSYAIIEQGMISRLIDAKPEELRVYLEEAAGISRYKERRRETENRIRHTRTNLERLDDLREELDRQLRTLKRQSEAAAKYKEYREEERALRAQLVVLRWQELESQREARSAELRERDVERERLLAEQAGLDRQIEEGRESLHVAGEEANRLQGRFYEVQSAISAREQEIRHQQERAAQFEADLEQTRENAREARAHLKVDSERLAALADELAAVSPDLEESRRREQESGARLQVAEQKMQDWQGQWDAFNARAEEPRREAGVQQSRIQQHERNIERFAERVRALEQEQSGLSHADLEQELAGLQRDVAVLEETVRRGQEGIEGVVAEIREQRAAIQDRDGVLEAARRELSDLLGRQASLEELQEHALGRRADALVGWFEANGLADARRLAECVEVDSGWETALETVLGEYLQAACADDLDGLADNALQAQGGVLTLVESGSAAPVATGGNLLLDKVRSPVDLRPLLAGVRVAENVVEAMRMRGGLADGESIITRDGLRVGRNWMRAAGVEDERSGVLARRQELERLGGEIARVEARVEACRTDIEEMRERLAQLEARRETEQGEVNQATRRLAEVRSECSARQARLEQLRNRGERLAAELADTREHLVQEQAALESSREAWQKALSAIEIDRAEHEKLLGLRDELRQQLDQDRQQARHDRDRTHELAMREQGIRSQQDTLGEAIERLQSQIAGLEERSERLQQNITEARDPLAGMQAGLQELLAERAGAESELATARDRVAAGEAAIRELEGARSRVEHAAAEVGSAAEQLRIDLRGIEVQLENLVAQLDELGRSREEVLAAMPTEADVSEWESSLQRVQNRIQRLGAINLAAIDEYQSQSERKAYMDAQYAELTEALDTLETAIRKIDRETRALFKDTFDKVNSEFGRLFPRVFGGGRAYLEMTGEDLLDTGVMIKAQPPGKKNGTIQQLSGGEKAMTAISLVFSIFNLNPAPFCMLDEVDAPLDDVNTGRFASLVESMSEKVQFIVITHNKITMEVARQLMGVTMHERGVSRVVSVDVEEMV